jgi:ketosteroid isomerase-like protein
MTECDFPVERGSTPRPRTDGNATGVTNMPTSRHSTLAAAGAGLAASQIAGAGVAAAPARGGLAGDDIVAELARQSAAANAALMRGDLRRYQALVTLTDDFTLMSPFGGTPTHGADMTSERWEAKGRFFANGTLEQEVVQTYGSADMVVLAVIERCRVEVDGLPAQEWPLRVTLVYRREEGEWRLAHRHADPLARGISLQQAAALARGEVT